MPRKVKYTGVEQRTSGDWAYRTSVRIGTRSVPLYQGGYDTAKAAFQAKEEAILAARDTGKRPRRMTISEALEEWRAGRAAHLADDADGKARGSRLGIAKGTASEDYYYLKYATSERRGVRTIGHMPCRGEDAPRSVHLKNLFADLEVSGALKDGAPLKPKTLQNIYGVLHKAFMDLLADEIIDRNPLATVRKPYVEKSQRPTWTPQQAHTVVQSVLDERLAPFWIIAALDGLRLGELAGLEDDLLYLDKGYGLSRVNRTRVAGTPEFSGGVVESTIKNRRHTAQEFKPFVITPATADVIRTFQHHKRKERLAAGSAYQATPWLLVDERGRPYAPGRLRAMHYAMCDGLGVERIHVHDMRRTCATLLHLSDLPDEIVELVLDDTPAMTDQYITRHVEPVVRRMQPGVQAVSDLLFG